MVFQTIFVSGRFRREIRDKKIDVVHINTALAPLSIMRDSFLAKAANAPVLLTCRREIFTRGFGNRFLNRCRQNAAAGKDGSRLERD